MNIFLIGLILFGGLGQPNNNLLEIPMDGKSLAILKSDNFKPVVLMDNSIIVEAEATGVERLKNNKISFKILLDQTSLNQAKAQLSFYFVTPPFREKSEAVRSFLEKNGKILSEDNNSYLYLTSREFAESLPKLRYEITYISLKGIVLPEEAENTYVPGTSTSLPTRNPVIDSVISKITTAELYQLISELSGEVPVEVWSRLDTIRTRYATAPKNSDAIWYCYEKLSSFTGLDSVKFNPFTWESTQHDSNVIATKLGTTYPQKYYIIGGHIDDISENPTVYAPGADDNGTGTVAMMIAAKYLSTIPFEYTIRFIAWNAEEFGLYGSEAHAQEARNRNDSILGVLNGDMLGTETINRDSLSIYTGSRAGSRALGDTFYSVNSTYGIGLHIGRSTQMPSYSDHYYYYQQGYNSNCIIEADFCPYYHTTQDRITANSFDIEFYAEVVRGMVATLATLAQPDTLYRDIGVIQITAPIGTVDSGTMIVPQAQVKNYGFSTETFSVSFRIGDFYNETRNKTLEPGQIDTVNFPSWTAIQLGTHATKCTTLLAGDMNQTNDYVTNSVTVMPLGIAETPNTQLLPKTFVLENNSPNPFLSQTLIRYALPKESHVNLQIYDVTGTMIRTLKTGTEKPGFYQVSWDGNDENGNKVAKGIYFYRLEADKSRAIKKMIKLN